MRSVWLGIIVAVAFSGASARAEGQSPAAGGVSPSVPAPGATPAAKKKVRRPRETETEGTTAPNRFEADPVIKSRYQLNGEQLEVDPD